MPKKLLVPVLAVAVAVAAFPITSASAGSPPNEETFTFTGAPETFTVPDDICKVTVTAVGAAGGSEVGSSDGGDGGEAVALIDARPGGELTVRVGGKGTDVDGDATGTAGGFNGGGDGGTGADAPFAGGAGGGGASDVRRSGDALTDRVVVAGGGGGVGGFSTANGGDGGGSSGDVGGAGSTATGGGGGTGLAGGAAGLDSDGLTTGGSGTAGEGGAGADGTLGAGTTFNGGGGGGGGGYFGGGGAVESGEGSAAAGGGGAGFTPDGTGHTIGGNVGDGSVTISWDPDSQPDDCAVDCSAPIAHPFTDAQTSFATGDIGCVRALGVTGGTTDTTYGPGEAVTREQMAAFMARLYRVITRETCGAVPAQFADALLSFAASDIGCILSLGVTSGTTSTTYGPGEPVTREQMAAFMARLYRVITGETCSLEPTLFTDVGTSFARLDIGCIISILVTSGTTSTTYGPGLLVTREQMAAFMARLYRAAT